MAKFRIRIRQVGIHTHMAVFAGPVVPGGAHTGSLIMQPDEADGFLAAIQAGSVGPEGSGADVEIMLAEPPESVG